MCERDIVNIHWLYIGELIAVSVVWTKNITFGGTVQEVNEKRLDVLLMRRVGHFNNRCEEKNKTDFSSSTLASLFSYQKLLLFRNLLQPS